MEEVLSLMEMVIIYHLLIVAILLMVQVILRLNLGFIQLMSPIIKTFMKETPTDQQLLQLDFKLRTLE